MLETFKYILNMKLKSILLLFLSMIMLHINSQNTENDRKKVLVAYFSWSGNTKEIANQIKEFTGADMFEIERATPYSSNYNTCVDEAKIEKEKNARPPILGKVENITDYDVVFIGYPNWWGTMPMPVVTFIESHDFSGKTLIPFCTHGGGGVQQCFKDFSKFTSKYESKEGFLSSGSSVERAKPHVEKWLKEKVGILK